MKNIKYIFIILFIINITIVNAQDKQESMNTSQPIVDYYLGYAGMSYDSIDCNGINIGLTIIDRNSSSFLYYGLDFAFMGLFNENDKFQSMLSVGPITGMNIRFDSGLTYQVGIATQGSILSLIDGNDEVYGVKCITTKSRMSIGFNNYYIQLEGGYHLTKLQDYNSFSISFKYVF